MADDRKARLRALANKAGRNKLPADDGDGAAEDRSGTTGDAPPGKPNIVFRNYTPMDKSLGSERDLAIEEESDPMKSPPSKRPRAQESSTAQVTSSMALQDALHEAEQQNPVEPKEAPTTNSSSTTQPDTVIDLAPKKINWDLKRDIADKIAKLERRTQKAIVKILKERLESEAAREVNNDESVPEDDGDLD